MKKRYIYSVLFGVPGLVIALVFAFLVFGAGAGFLWIFVYGDNPWPASAEKILPALFVVAFLAAWLMFTVAGFIFGKRLESKPGLSGRHILASVVATLVPVVLMVLHQYSVGNIGTKHVSVICSDFCRSKGYSASVMPPRDSNDRTCTCLDSDGSEAIKTLLDK